MASLNDNENSSNKIFIKSKSFRTYLLNYQNSILWKGKLQPTKLLIEMRHLEKELALLRHIDYNRYRRFE